MTAKPKVKPYPKDKMGKEGKRRPRPPGWGEGSKPERKPDKPRNKRTGEDFLDREKKSKQNWDAIREKIKKDRESRKDRRRTLPYKI